MSHRALVFLLPVLAVLLGGCQEETVKRGDGGSATGHIGSIANRPSPADVYVELSGAYLSEGALQQALLNANKAVAVDPGSSGAQNMLALVRQRLGQEDLAEEHFKRAVELDPRNPYALNAYGSFLCGRERYTEADVYFQRALANPLYRTPWLAWHNAGLCAHRRNDQETAEASFRRALQSNPRFAPALLRMVAISLRQENYLSARAYLQRFEEVSGHTAESLWMGIQAERQLGDKDRVASYELLLRQKYPDSDQVKKLGGKKQ